MKNTWFKLITRVLSVFLILALSDTPLHAQVARGQAKVAPPRVGVEIETVRKKNVLTSKFTNMTKRNIGILYGEQKIMLKAGGFIRLLQRSMRHPLTGSATLGAQALPLSRLLSLHGWKDHRARRDIRACHRA
jgi:hypothetical protein